MRGRGASCACRQSYRSASLRVARRGSRWFHARADGGFAGGNSVRFEMVQTILFVWVGREIGFVWYFHGARGEGDGRRDERRWGGWRVVVRKSGVGFSNTAWLSLRFEI